MLQHHRSPGPRPLVLSLVRICCYLFRSDVFRRVGGFENCIEEDREFRNRLIFSGEVLWVIPELLLTKIETRDILTQSAISDYDSERRKADDC